jgi:hypothetical protein
VRSSFAQQYLGGLTSTPLTSSRQVRPDHCKRTHGTQSNGIGSETHPGLPNSETDEMGTVNKKGKSFFEIAPQEVRDLIYDATFHHEAKRGHVTSNFDAPCLHLRLVSRQFKDEYDKQTPKRTKLVLCFDAEIVPLRSRRLSTFVPALAIRCTLIELRYLAHKFQLFDGYGERSQNFAAFSALCMGLVMSMTHPRSLEIRLIWDSVSVFEDFATQCRRTFKMNTCVTTALRSLLFAESYLSRRAFDAEIVLLALATALKAPSTSNYSTAVWRALVRLAAWTPMFPGLSYLKSPPS